MSRLVKIGDNKIKVEDLPYFDVVEAAKRPPVEPGTGVLAFSNQFQIATRDEPMSVQRGVVASYSKLYGRLGIFEATYKGDVYVVDAITNNPGAAGGALTTRKGELLGLIGKELRNELTNTWINYAIPINAAHHRHAGRRQGRDRQHSRSHREEREIQAVDARTRGTRDRAFTPAFSWWPIRWNAHRRTSRTWCPARRPTKPSSSPTI